MTKYASEVVKQAKAWIGYNEKDGTHKQIIDVYNSQAKLPRGYRVKYSDEWCATTVSAVAVKLGYTDIIPTECGCQKMIELFKKLGAWQEDESVTPKSGWILFYDWEDDGKGDNTGRADHVGIVEKVSDGKITVIEGNYKNAVTRRVLSVNGKYIRGYGVPKYDTEPSTIVNKPTTNTTTNTATINGKIDTVVEVQKWLNNDYNSGLETDGIYGKLTKSALIKVVQIGLGFKDKNVNGVYNKKTNVEIKKNNLKRGSKGTLVKALQGLLVCNGYSSAYVDGSFGSGTETAVRNYQSKKKIKVDGVAGSGTFIELCT